MSYTIKYTGTRKERFVKATADALAFNAQGVRLLCAEFPTMWKLATDLHMRKQCINAFYLYAEFAGIHGLPVRALMRRALGIAPFSPVREQSRQP